MRAPLLLATLPFVLVVNAQSPYRPFPEGNAGWIESHGWLSPDGGGFVYNTSERIIRFGTDSVIDGTTYHRLYKRGQGSWQTTSPPISYGTFTEPEELFVHFRQDVEARKVYAYDTQAGAEMLWYDFTLGLGAYPPTYGSQTANYIEVVALDSMQLADGYHRTWVLGVVYEGQVEDSAFCTVIEGVGSTYGLNPVVGLVPPFEWNDLLLCHQRGAVDVYSLLDAPCDLSMAVAVNDPAPAALTVAPNPATGQVRFAQAMPGARCTIIDANGREVGAQAIPDGIVDLGRFPAGIYLLNVSDAQGLPLGRVRVVKE